MALKLANVSLCITKVMITKVPDSVTHLRAMVDRSEIPPAIVFMCHSVRVASHRARRSTSYQYTESK